MNGIDIEFIRSNFPAFEEPSLKDFAMFENAGGSYACGQCIDRLHQYYIKTKVQPYYEFPASALAGRQMDRARERMAEWMNVAGDEIHFGPSTSQNTYVIAQALRRELKPGDEVIVTNQDHEANIGAWSRLEQSGITVREWRVDPDTAELHPMDLEVLLNERTRVVAFTHCSNLVGTINPVREITDMVHQAGALAIVDGVSFAPHGIPEIEPLGADIYLFSLYKVYGPHLGVMYMSREVNGKLPYQGHFFNADKPTARFTPAGPDHAQIASVNGVMDYLDAVHEHHAGSDADRSRRTADVHRLFRDHESRLLQPLLDFLDDHPQVRLIGKTVAEQRAPTVAFTVPGRSSMELARSLSEFDIGVGVGNFYAYRLIEALGIDVEDGAIRASFVHYTTDDEVQRLIRALDQLI